MPTVIRAFPVLPGKEPAVRKFAAELTVREAEASTLHRKFGVSHESWHLQPTPSGLVVIVLTQVTDKPLATAAADYASSSASFDTWFKEQVFECSGIDPSKEPLGPPTTCVYHWPPKSAND